MTATEIEKIKNEGRLEVLSVVTSIMEDLRLIEENPAEYNERQDIRHYMYMKKQIDVIYPLAFGYNINVLLITDRLHSCMQGLIEYLSNSTDISVDFAFHYNDVLKIIEQKNIDFFIIVGMFDNSINYKSIQAVRDVNKNTCVIMYAYLSSVIKEICAANNIEFSFDRYKPLKDFFSYLCYRYADNLTQQQQAMLLQPNVMKIQQDSIELHKANARKTKWLFNTIKKFL